MSVCRDRISAEVSRAAHWGRTLVADRSPLPGEHTPEPCATCQHAADQIIAIYTDIYTDTPPTRCGAEVYVRDTYRRTGRTKSGFEMHYTRRQCSRKPGPNGYCWQHNPKPGA